MREMTRSALVFMGTGSVTLLMLCAGVAKLLNATPIAAKFAAWGYAHWFMYVVGTVEVCAAILFLMPRTVVYGAIMICAVMLGAIATHLMHAEPLESLIGIAVIVATILSADARKQPTTLARMHHNIFDPDAEGARPMERMK